MSSPAEDKKDDHLVDDLQCACIDEERCCPCFWKDDGVPPIWPLSWVFDHDNKYLNDNKYMHKFGHCGLKCADKNRKALMGIALLFTFFSIIITGFGCFALSTNPKILRITAWGISYHRNETTETGIVAYIGLRRFVIRSCASATSNDFFDFTDCETEDAVFWDELECESGEFAFGYPCDEVNVCKDQAVGNQFGAFTTAATLILALNGCLTRIRRAADSNLQKLLGTLPDAFGVISLGAAMLAFGVGCYSDQSRFGEDGVELFYLPGPGYVAYSICWVVAVTRTVIHSLIPVPGKGLKTGLKKDIGCCFTCCICCVEADRRAVVAADEDATFEE
mmetsp:Transcript_17515/g.20303  ORF Transcript_17515/g.20303 Transcript_17515/m.20303 type:complete len:335 (-) Transcript_17515:127-1131(-)